MTTVILRKMTQEDIPMVMEIEEAVCEFPWSASIYSDCIRVGYHCFVLAREAGQVQEIVGYGLLSVAAGEAHVLNICIKPSAQHQGLGYRMMQHLIQLAKELFAHRIYLEVRLSNIHAIALYKKLAFTQIGERKDYYPSINGREDALVFAKHLDTTYTT
jgi:ribosomal-protein-alanine N-acetyltransferase